ncbi:hypothetical protein Nepgr_012814 [Nepenthes gracilis]|uniref:Uncharacterized protein n=1 Tax=Nepenthes gracilis TaxID=150966 RepID=A0AAD3SGM8_NEPGR|nr:hypothetical protein Nepgr_012814 [Nepenthes gracilis]
MLSPSLDSPLSPFFPSSLSPSASFPTSFLLFLFPLLRPSFFLLIHPTDSLSSSAVGDKWEGGSEKATVAVKNSPLLSCAGRRIVGVRHHYSVTPPLFIVESGKAVSMEQLCADRGILLLLQDFQKLSKLRRGHGGRNPCARTSHSFEKKEDRA